MSTKPIRASHGGVAMGTAPISNLMTPTTLRIPERKRSGVTPLKK
jgi:hypothetical protein